MGDIGNVIRTDADGAAQFDQLIDLLSLSAATTNIIGRAVVIHSQSDDGDTQPTGEADRGSLIGIGVIGLSNKAMPPMPPAGQVTP